MGVGALVVLPVMDKHCRISDGAFLIIGLLARLCRLLLLCFSNTATMIFSAAAITLPVVFITSAAKSALSKTLAPDEIGEQNYEFHPSELLQ